MEHDPRLVLQQADSQLTGQRRNVEETENGRDEVDVPGDGRVKKGRSTINQASITGESVPANKEVDDEVFGGTVNLTGQIDIEITKAGQDTTLGQVQSLILQAERSRTPILRMIDRYAGWYTPTVLMLAGIALFFSRDT